MVAANRDAHLQSLTALRARLPFVSQSALSDALRIARDEKLPKLWRRGGIRAARDQSTNIDTPYGKVHQTLSVNAAKGIELNIEYQNPQAVR